MLDTEAGIEGVEISDLPALMNSKDKMSRDNSFLFSYTHFPVTPTTPTSDESTQHHHHLLAFQCAVFPILLSETMLYIFLLFQAVYFYNISVEYNNILMLSWL